MKRHDVYGIGNALVDMEFEVTPEFLKARGIEKSVMTLVDEARQKELIVHMHGIQHRRSCGGSAANTLIAVAELGGKAFYSCKVADDELGDFYMTDLGGNGVRTNITGVRSPGFTGRCMVFITPDADRTMNTYLGVSADLSRAEIRSEDLKDSEFLYIEGYLLASAKGRDAAFMARDSARAAGVKLSLTFSDPGLVLGFSADFRELIGTGFDLLFCNEAEAKALTGTTCVESAAAELKKMARTFVITRGPRGAFLHDGARDIHILTRKVEAVDTNGSGDAFAGCFLYGLTHGYSFADAGRLACTAATQLVTQFGARLKPEQMRAIRDEILGAVAN